MSLFGFRPIFDFTPKALQEGTGGPRHPVCWAWRGWVLAGRVEGGSGCPGRCAYSSLAELSSSVLMPPRLSAVVLWAAEAVRTVCRRISTRTQSLSLLPSLVADETVGDVLRQEPPLPTAPSDGLSERSSPLTSQHSGSLVVRKVS